MVLEFKDVVKFYRGPGEMVRAVDGVSMSVGAGEFVALYGRSGSGKSTLLMLAAGILASDSGVVSFMGSKVCTLDQALYLRHSVGFVRQQTKLMPGVSALDNAASKLLADRVSRREARRAATPWLMRLGLSERLGHTPEQLSGGERQRVAIAKALVGEPRLLLLDEPTGNLDTARVKETLGMLAEICREKQIAILLATHDEQAAQFATRVCALRDGKLREQPSGALRVAG